MAGQVITFPPSGGVIGRGNMCTVVLADELASRQHATFEPVGAGWTVADLGSTNGTRVNGHPIPPQQPVLLQPGDEVQVGASAFVVVLAPSAAGPPAARRPIGPDAGDMAQRPPVARPAAGGPGRRAGPWTWLGRLLAALGGILLVAGAFLPWLQVTVTPTLLGFTLGERTATISGMQGFGPLTLALGALLLLVVLVDALLRAGGKWPGVVILLVGVAGIVVMGIGVATFETSSQQMAQQLGKAFGVDLLSVLESPVFREILNAIGNVVQPELALREGILMTATGLLLALLGGVSRLIG